MSLLRLDDVSLEFGEQKIFTAASFALEAGERVCLVGRNGAGKTTLFRLLTGVQTADSGNVQISPDLTISELEQTLPQELDLTVPEYVTQGLARIRALRMKYETLASADLDRHGLRELETLQRKLDALGGWRLEQRVATYISELDLPVERTLGELSGGWRRRVALARALVGQPDVLLLDEPTNHLDLVTIRWLEEVVRGFPGSVIFVTHDRAFVQTLATRIVELDRGRLVSWPGDYANFLRRRDEALAAEQRENARFDKRLAEEEVWIRQGIKARRTRNEGRVRALEAMREQRAARIGQSRSANMHIDQADDSGRKVIRLHNVSHRFDDKPLIEDFSHKLMRGDRVGLVGNNGVGKSTLLKIMLGAIEPQQGTVKHGTNLKIGYYDPLRQDLEPDKSVAYNVGQGRDFLDINGRQHHVVGYLKGFLFSPKRALTPVKALSGGERNRVLLARLFTQSSNLLVLDEPTNDLDVETLEVLEQKLTEYNGTLIVVSHDRRFLDNVVTSILVFEHDHVIREYVGGFSDWQQRGRQLADVDRQQSARSSPGKPPRERGSAPTKLSYKDQRELDALPTQIAQLEAQIAELTVVVTAADFYAQSYDKTHGTLTRFEELKATLARATDRWIELEERQDAFNQN